MAGAFAVALSVGAVVVYPDGRSSLFLGLALVCALLAVSRSIEKAIHSPADPPSVTLTRWWLARRLAARRLPR